MEQEKTLKELFDSILDSIEKDSDQSYSMDNLPTDLEIMAMGLDAAGIKTLFSEKVDKIIFALFHYIDIGNFDKILENSGKLEEILNLIFGEGSFQGPISQAVLGNIRASMESYKYAKLRSMLGKTATKLKKIRFVVKNLESGKKNYLKNSEEYKKYVESVYAIKQVLKFVAKIYSGRKYINSQVISGVNHIVHESKEA